MSRNNNSYHTFFDNIIATLNLILLLLAAFLKISPFAVNCNQNQLNHAHAKWCQCHVIVTWVHARARAGCMELNDQVTPCVLCGRQHCTVCRMGSACSIDELDEFNGRRECMHNTGMLNTTADPALMLHNTQQYDVVYSGLKNVYYQILYYWGNPL